MAKPFEQWTVLPHGPLHRVDDGLLSVTGRLPMPVGDDFPRRMTVARLRDGRLVIFSAIALDEDEMSELERLGTPSFLIVPGVIHRMDAKTWKQRYPALKVLAPAGARKKVEEVVPVDATASSWDDPDVRFTAVAGTADREGALIVERESGTTLVLNDLIFSLADRPGFTGWLFKVTGMTGQEPHIPALIKMGAVDDKRAVAAQLEAWSRLPRLKRIVVSHADIIAQDPAAVLERIARELRA